MVLRNEMLQNRSMRWVGNRSGQVYVYTFRVYTRSKDEDEGEGERAREEVYPLDLTF